MKRLTARLAFLFILLAAAFAATAGSAAARTSCGEKVIDDWYGSKTGQLSHFYPLHCYRDALNLIKTRSDLQIYSNARQDILFALQQALAHRKGGGPQDPTNSLVTADARPSFLGGPDAKYGGHAPPGVQPITLRPLGPHRCGPACDVLNSGNSSASSVPLPAIVLGAIAALLLALGSAAYLARRRQQRRQTFRPRPANGRNP